MLECVVVRITHNDQQVSDDDFVDPPPKKAKTDTKQTGQFSKSQVARRNPMNTRQPMRTTKPYLPIVNGKLLLRTALKHMVTVVESFNQNQRNTVIKIGFGSILGFQMRTVPSSLGWWLVKNYDHKTCILNAGSQQIHITEELVHEIFGVPRGVKLVEEVERARADFNEVVAEWKNQFIKAPKRMTPIPFKTNLVSQDSYDRACVLNFLIFYNTILGETTHNSSVNMRFLPSMHRGVDIKSYNWCEYMIRCLNRNAAGWEPKDNFFGPLPLLVAALVNDQMTNDPDQPRSIRLIGDIVQDNIDELSIKLEKVRFEQMLANEKGLNPPQKYPFVKKDDDEGKGEQNVQTNVTRCEDKTQVQPKRIVGNVKKRNKDIKAKNTQVILAKTQNVVNRPEVGKTNKDTDEPGKKSIDRPRKKEADEASKKSSDGPKKKEASEPIKKNADDQKSMNSERDVVQAVDANMNMLDGKNTDSVEKEADPSAAESEKTGM
ncbi:hypothetical protein HanRHA438_Chr08g0343231 [Helianthus annuus]|nr:hypothetical protein HanHA89_Chr08g0291341 [Helianthus annuus]KAJ0897217.1 hypothetical protein HanRHA438_Chr08g0343231 [Helianthus annuus]